MTEEEEWDGSLYVNLLDLCTGLLGDPVRQFYTGQVLGQLKLDTNSRDYEFPRHDELQRN